MKNQEYYKEFNKEELEKLPVSYQMLTKVISKSKIMNSDNEEYTGIEVKLYNTTIIEGSRHYSPISKIIDFE